MKKVNNKELKCPKCGSDCYIWIEEDVTSAIEKPLATKFLIFCINDCGIVGDIEGMVIVDKKTLKIGKQ